MLAMLRDWGLVSATVWDKSDVFTPYDGKV